MFRFEVDEQRKIIVLVVHGTQDGWEGKLMWMDWDERIIRNRTDWKLIVDLSEYIAPHGTAVKEQKKLVSKIASQSLPKKMLIRAHNPESNVPFVEGISWDEYPDFLSAWRSAGGDSRDRRIAPPSDGSKYPANNPPPPAA